MAEWEEQAKKLIKAMPWWGWAASGGVALGGVYYLRTHTSGAKGVPASSANATSAGTQPEYQPPDGLSMADLAGMPYDYYDWSAANAPGGQPLPTPPPVDSPPPNGTPSAPVGNPSYPPMLPPRPVIRETNPTSNPVGHLPPTLPGPVAAQPLANTAPPGTLAGAAQVAPAVYHRTVEPFPAWDSTLSGIAAHYGMSWQSLYDYGNDRQIIDSAAHAHGHYSQEWNWLFPGEQLEVPSPN